MRGYDVVNVGAGSSLAATPTPRRVMIGEKAADLIRDRAPAVADMARDHPVTPVNATEIMPILRSFDASLRKQAHNPHLPGKEDHGNHHLR